VARLVTSLKAGVVGFIPQPEGWGWWIYFLGL